MVSQYIYKHRLFHIYIDAHARTHTHTHTYTRTRTDVRGDGEAAVGGGAVCEVELGVQDLGLVGLEIARGGGRDGHLVRLKLCRCEEVCG